MSSKQIGAAKHRESRTLGETVGAELTRLRVARGWSQQKLADELGAVAANFFPSQSWSALGSRELKIPTTRADIGSPTHSAFLCDCWHLGFRSERGVRVASARGRALRSAARAFPAYLSVHAALFPRSIVHATTQGGFLV